MESMENGSWTLNPQELPPVRDGTKIGLEGLIESEKPTLIPGLPDDIAFSCLARVPRKYHPVLNCVSKRWRELICGERVRKGVGFEVLGKKVYLFGGCGWIEDATDDVYCYDATMSTWTRAGSLSTPRCFFAYEALDGKIYAIGGLGSKSSNPHSWDIYDSHTNCWSSHADPNVIPDIEDSVVLDGKIYIRCGISAVSSHVYAVVYEPSSGTWQHADTDMACGWRGPAVVIDGILYVLDQTSGVRLMMWQNEAREWMAIRRLSTHLIIPPCRLVAIDKKIFVVGKGLSTVMFDVENAGCADGVLVSSSLRLTSSDEVISCKTLAI
ncbi:UNVERIFIED_CONTAM: F-box/kelch-repeat protein SKIP4 [Sesamum radiatum]|uniref:F-box/kelch-repeat protein SKIP4 n=1 Tax=Sesamum radiatum TaxID=300843 RepID=A0AAW2VHQ7_SESRA